MNDLTATELRRALSAAHELAALRDLSEFPASASRLLRKLIPCEHAGYNAIDVRSGRAIVVADPPEVVFDSGPELLAEFSRQNPIIVRAASGAQNVLQLSDYMTRRELHRTDIYDHVYRRIGLEYQLGVLLHFASGGSEREAGFVGVSLTRTHRDFGARDRALLGAVAPLLSCTLARLRELAVLRARACAGTERDDAPLVLVDSLGVVAWADACATNVLGLTAGARLPPSLERWRQHARRGSAEDQIVTVAGEAVRPRLIADAQDGLDAIHMTRSVRVSDDTEALLALGLTPRQADVLSLLIQGHTSREIAAVLGLSPRTVEKHIDGIYERLRVRNRSQAVAAAVRHLAA